MSSNIALAGRLRFTLLGQLSGTISQQHRRGRKSKRGCCREFTSCVLARSRKNERLHFLCANEAKRIVKDTPALALHETRKDFVRA